VSTVAVIALGPGLVPTTVRRWGAGPPVVLLHGLPTGSWLWEGVGARLADAGYQAIAPDLPGYGATPCPIDASLDRRWHAAWLDGVLGALNLGCEPHLVGQDYGGLLAADRAARVGAASLCLSSTAVDLCWLPVRLTALPLVERYFYRRFGGRRWLAMGVEAAQLDRLTALCAAALADPSMPERMRRTAAGLDPSWLWSLPQQLRDRCQTLCLWGQADQSVPPAIGRWTARRVGGRFELVPGRHYACWEHPETYAAALLAHLGPAQAR
jgi:3-oxoadipate enol-lactonase